MRINGEIKNYRLFFEPERRQFYVGEKRFGSLHELVADGIIHLFIEARAKSYIESMTKHSVYVEMKKAIESEEEIDARVVPSSPYAAIPVDSYNTSSSESETHEMSTVDPIYEAISDSESDSAHHQMSLNSRTSHSCPSHRNDSSSLAMSLTSKSSISNMSTGSTGRHSSTSGSGSESSSSITSSPPNAKKMSQSSRVLNSIKRSLSFNSRRKSRVPASNQTQTIPKPAHRGPNYEKEHDFKVTTYKGKRYCAYCGNYMWGLIEQGVQCGECGIDAHKNCSRHIPFDCCPDPKLIRGVFGVDLVTIVTLHGTHRPLVVGLCVSELERRGAHSTEGLYRENGDGTLIDKLRLQFDHNVAEVQLSEVDTYTVASLLKTYLRQLPKPLIHAELYPRFLNAIQLPDQDFATAVNMIRLALNLLHPAHYLTLEFLVGHLGRVAEHEGQNKMGVSNLGVCFGPVLFRSLQASRDLAHGIKEVENQKRLVSFLIKHRQHLFHHAR